jgi:ferredoxin
MLSLLGKLIDNGFSPVEFIPQRCLRARLNSSDCRRCLDGCAAGALSLDMGKIHLRSSLCTTCLRCIARCPNEAFGPGFDPKAALAEAGTAATLLFSCSRQARTEAAEVVLPCLAVFSPVVLLYLACCGPAKIIFNTVDCPGCVNRAGVAAMIADLERIRQFVGPAARTELRVMGGCQGGELVHPGGNRRSFLVDLKKRALAFCAVGVAGGEVDAPDTAGRKRTITGDGRLLADMVRREPQAMTLLSSILPQARVSANCSPCHRCSGICPTGALRLVTDGQEKKLQFQPLACSGCGLCASFCKAGALELSPSSLLPAS